LPNGGAYRFHAHIDGTGTDQSATAVYWNQNGTWKLNVTYQSGSTSNHPEFIIDGGVPKISIDHTSNYTVQVLGERLELSESTGTDNKSGFGTDAYFSVNQATLRFNPSGAGAINSGDLVWHAGNDGSGSGLDADKLDGQQGSYYLDYNNFTNTPSGGGGGGYNMEVFHTSGTYTKPSGLKGVRVTVTGGGGSAGDAPYSNGNGHNGGTAGGTAIKYIPASSLSSTTSVTVSGEASVTHGSNSGVAGGTSSFGSHCSGTGGNQGSSLNSMSGNGTGGDINIMGGTRPIAYRTDSGNIVFDGGSSYWGGRSANGAGVSQYAPSGTTRNLANARGIGQGGAGYLAGQSGGIDHNGAAGIVVVEEFF
jgi:hypothetical protein